MADAERPDPRPGILYVDTSALLKLLVREAESEAVEMELLQWSKLATSVVTEVELPRRDLAAVVTYDHRMQDALARIKVEVLAPEALPELDDRDEDAT